MKGHKVLWVVLVLVMAMVSGWSALKLNGNSYGVGLEGYTHFGPSGSGASLGVLDINFTGMTMKGNDLGFFMYSAFSLLPLQVSINQGGVSQSLGQPLSLILNTSAPSTMYSYLIQGSGELLFGMYVASPLSSNVSVVTGFGPNLYFSFINKTIGSSFYTAAFVGMGGGVTVSLLFQLNKFFGIQPFLHVMYAPFDFIGSKNDPSTSIFVGNTSVLAFNGGLTFYVRNP